MTVKRLIDFLRNHLIIRTLLLISLVALILLATLLFGLNRYTRHGHAINVPNIEKMFIEDAVPLLARYNLKCEIIDSIYVSGAIPGSIIDQTPQEGSKVKENRIIFVTVNARSPRKIAVPDVKDMSQRQAIAFITGMVFPEPSTEYITSEYKDLVIEIYYKGHPVEKGTKLPADAQLTLKVGDGYMQPTFISDSDSIEVEAPVIDEEWLE